MSLAAVKSNKSPKVKVRANCVAICAHYMSVTASCDSSDLSHVCVYTSWYSGFTLDKIHTCWKTLTKPASFVKCLDARFHGKDDFV